MGTIVSAGNILNSAKKLEYLVCARGRVPEESEGERSQRKLCILSMKVSCRRTAAVRDMQDEDCGEAGR